MHFEIISAVEEVETIARGRGIRELKRLKRLYGAGSWRRRKGIATIKFENDSIFNAELHWYEASSIGKREFKVKKLIKRS
jgi:hypothetical protein